MKYDFDLCVIGAGPAGAMAAFHAVEKGKCSVALFERQDRPSHPVRCGEAVGRKGISRSLELRPEWIMQEISRVRFVSPSGLKVDLTQIEPSYVLDRQKMDNDLVDRAIAAGVRYFSNTPVTEVEHIEDKGYACVIGGGEFVRCQAVVIADGVESRLARSLGWNTTVGLEDMESCAFCRVVDPSITDESTIELHTGSHYSPGGFVWIFPRGKGNANVGLGILGSKCKPGLPRKMLEKFVADKFPNGSVEDLHAGGVPVGKGIKSLVKHGVLLVGDAARQVDCLKGGGIAYALYAGKIAGEAVADAMDGGKIIYNSLVRYEQIWNEYCGKQQLRSYYLKSMIIKKSDLFYDKIARSLRKRKQGRLSYMHIFIRTFLWHPIHLLKVYFLFR